jgi:hypothetical protein
LTCQVLPQQFDHNKQNRVLSGFMSKFCHEPPMVSISKNGNSIGDFFTRADDGFATTVKFALPIEILTSPSYQFNT